MRTAPVLARESFGPHVVAHTDPALWERRGIRIAFTERTGGVSQSPYDSLNLAGHVGDDPAAVDENRQRLFHGLGIAHLRDRLVTAQQVHGERIEVVYSAQAGAGAHVCNQDSWPMPKTDALLTLSSDMPIMMLYADCVPVIMVAEEPLAAVGIVHAGWRGTLSSLPAQAASHLAALAGCFMADLAVYIGPHIGSCCYKVDDQLVNRFCEKFGSTVAMDGHLDLTAAVIANLTYAGVAEERIVCVNECTFDHVDRYFSYRASSVTGRHGAIAFIAQTRV